jgi:hypothetical protein
MRLRATIGAANERFNRCSDAYEDAEPVPGDVMRHRIEDHLCGFRLPIGPKTRAIAAESKHSSFYSDDEIKQLKNAPAVRDADERARVEEILAEWDRWNAECVALADRVGLTAADEAIVELVRSQSSLIKRIAAIPATTIVGLRVRAMVLVPILDEDGYDEDYDDQILIRAIVRDLCAMPDQSV